MIDIERLAATWLEDAGLPRPVIKWATFDLPGQLGQAEYDGATPVIVLATSLREDDSRLLRVAAHEAGHLALKHVRPVSQLSPFARSLITVADYRSEEDAERHRRIEEEAEAWAQPRITEYLCNRILDLVRNK